MIVKMFYWNKEQIFIEIFMNRNDSKHYADKYHHLLVFLSINSTEK